MKPAQVAVSGLVVRDDSILLVQRGNWPHEGKWAVPGGKLETGESVREAIAREVLEETGVTVDVGEFAGWVERIGSGLHFLILSFHATPRSDGAPVAGDDAHAARWVGFGELCAFDLVDGLLDFLHSTGIVDQ